MRESDIIKRAHELLDKYEKPKMLYSFSDDIDEDRLNIQEKYISKAAVDLMSSECVELILCFTLISDNAIIYYLPRLLEAVILEDKWHEHALYARLELIKENVDKSIKDFLKEVIFFLRELEVERSEIV